jgi:GNAT superfamily N-acetyltransferase
MKQENHAYHIDQLDQPAWEVIGGGINAFNTQQAGDDQAKNLCFVVKNDQDEILGGVIGTTYWDWLSVELMWLREDLRGQGLGQQLLHMAEDEARRRGAKQAFLDTFSFQAPGFYKKNGYKVFGQLSNFPQGHQRYFMTKKL